MNMILELLWNEYVKMCAFPKLSFNNALPQLYSWLRPVPRICMSVTWEWHLPKQQLSGQNFGQDCGFHCCDVIPMPILMAARRDFITIFLHFHSQCNVTSRTTIYNNIPSNSRITSTSTSISTPLLTCHVACVKWMFHSCHIPRATHTPLVCTTLRLIWFLFCFGQPTFD